MAVVKSPITDLFMKFRNSLFFLFLLLVTLVFLVDCANKKNKDQQSDDYSDTLMVTGFVNELTESEISSGWELLFDGSSLDGWRKFQSEEAPEGWIVDDGMLVALGAGGDIGGDIVTDKEFEDFHLKLEWKISEGGNSGIMYHVQEADYPAPYATGPEYQLIDDIGYPGKLEKWQSCGADYAMHPPVKPRLKPANEWNSSELIVEGSHVKHYLNDVLVVEFETGTDEWEKLVKSSKWADYSDYGKASKGHLALQDHGSKVYFRKR